jgi:hypothetical protein
MVRVGSNLFKTPVAIPGSFMPKNVSIPRLPRSEIIYPDSDGKPMADNTLQFRWIVTIKEGLEWVSQDQPKVFGRIGLQRFQIPELQIADSEKVLCRRALRRNQAPEKAGPTRRT